jgi:hypothetical protein
MGCDDFAAAIPFFDGCGCWDGSMMSDEKGFVRGNK